MKFMDKHAGVWRHAAAMFTMVLICVMLSPACRSNAKEIQTSTMMEAQKKTDVHDEPNTGSQVLGQLEKGDRIFAVELTEGGWYRVVYQGKTGYVKEDCLKIYSTGEWDAPQNPDDTGPSGEIINPQEEFKKKSEEAAAIKKRSMGVTIGVFAGAVLLIVAYGAYVVVKEGKETKKSENDDTDSENIQDGNAGQESGDGEMVFLDLEQENEADKEV